MLDYESSPRGKQAGTEHQSRYLPEAGQIVRRVGKDEIVFRLVGRNEFEHVALYQPQIGLAKRLRHFAYERILRAAFLHGRDRSASPRKQFKTDGTRASKQVECGDALKVDTVLYHIEYILARKIGCRTRRYVFRHVEPTIKSNGASMALRPNLSSRAGNIDCTTTRT